MKEVPDQNQTTPDAETALVEVVVEAAGKVVAGADHEADEAEDAVVEAHGLLAITNRDASDRRPSHPTTHRHHKLIRRRQPDPAAPTKTGGTVALRDARAPAAVTAAIIAGRSNRDQATLPPESRLARNPTKTPPPSHANTFSG